MVGDATWRGVVRSRRGESVPAKDERTAERAPVRGREKACRIPDDDCDIRLGVRVPERGTEIVLIAQERVACGPVTTDRVKASAFLALTLSICDISYYRNRECNKSCSFYCKSGGTRSVISACGPVKTRRRRTRADRRNRVGSS